MLNNLHVTDGLNENTFQQMLNKTTIYHSNIYNLNTLKTIRDMLKDNKARCDFPKNNKVKLENGELFHFILEKRDDSYVDIKGLKRSQND